MTERLTRVVIAVKWSWECRYPRCSHPLPPARRMMSRIAFVGFCQRQLQQLVAWELFGYRCRQSSSWRRIEPRLDGDWHAHRRVSRHHSWGDLKQTISRLRHTSSPATWATSATLLQQRYSHPREPALTKCPLWTSVIKWETQVTSGEAARDKRL